jgi:hypothetical protein
MKEKDELFETSRFLKLLHLIVAEGCNWHDDSDYGVQPNLELANLKLDRFFHMLNLNHMYF